MKTKHPYLKEILKTTGKVALIAGLTAVATPYLFGFATGLFNMITAGYIAGALTLGAGTLIAAKTLIKDTVTMRERVEKKRQEERLERLHNELAKVRQHYREDQQLTPERTEEDTRAKRLTFLQGLIERRRQVAKEKHQKGKTTKGPRFLGWLRRRENKRAA